ncbi:MAG: putative metal-binding motif-containing protein [Myxococcaceae bacterium]|nr:putative metal-binding motif-containing protein [Myxococcaceae bacterium]
MRLLPVVALMLSACFNPVAEPCRSKLRCGLDGGEGGCSVGSTRSCGSTLGICKAGRQTCGTSGTWGRCIGGVVAGVEVCDGLDNNCDGVVDDGVMRACPLKKGVCAGAASGCGDAGTCEAAYGAQYQAFETKCDGLDNDCDGVVDRSAPVNVSRSPGVVSRRAAATAVPGSEAVLVLYEEGDKVAARVLKPDGTLTDAVPPSTTVDSATRASLPALAASGATLVGAWVEETATEKRVMVATLDPLTGRSNLSTGAALPALNVTQPNDVAVALDEAGQRLVVAVTDTNGLRIVAFSSAVPMGAPSVSVDPYDVQGRRVMVAPFGGSTFTFAHDRNDGLMRRAFIPSSGTAFPTEGSLSMGRDPALFGIDGGYVSVFLSGGAMARQVWRGSCVVTSGVACSDTMALTAAGDLDLLEVSAGQLAAWQAGVSSPRVQALWLGRPDAGAELSPGRRPVPVATAQRGWVVFDTESVSMTGVDSDEVYVMTTCR